MQNQKKKIVALLERSHVHREDSRSCQASRTGGDICQDVGGCIGKGQGKPEVIILDLNTNSVEPLDVIEKLKADSETCKINLLGYVSHVQVDLKMAAQQKGCDIVMARSAFSQNLPLILKRYAEASYAHRH